MGQIAVHSREDVGQHPVGHASRRAYKGRDATREIATGCWQSCGCTRDAGNPSSARAKFRNSGYVPSGALIKNQVLGGEIRVIERRAVDRLQIGGPVRAEAQNVDGQHDGGEHRVHHQPGTGEPACGNSPTGPAGNCGARLKTNWMNRAVSPLAGILKIISSRSVASPRTTGRSPAIMHSAKNCINGRDAPTGNRMAATPVTPQTAVATIPCCMIGRENVRPLTDENPNELPR